MSHNHSHHHSHNNEHHSSENIAIAFILNFSFTIIEAVGGLLTNSMAILSDAIHDLGDSVSLGLAWYFDKLSQHKPTARFTYGYKRFSLLGALINCVILSCGSIWVFYEGITRLINPATVNAKGMFLLSIIGIVVNGAGALKTGLMNKKRRGVNERVVSLHLLEDVLGWMAVFIVSIVMIFVEVPILDPILSICISVFILYNVVRNLKSVFQVILQGVPEEIDSNEIRTHLLTIDGIDDIHDLHLWSLDSEYAIATMHVVVNNWEQSYLATLKQTIKREMSEHGINHITIEFEAQNEACDRCD